MIVMIVTVTMIAWKSCFTACQNIYEFFGISFKK